jgi:uncharacterized protein (TIGR00730 family)
MRRVCVYCGSSPGRDPVYGKAVADLALALVRRGIGIVYGGGAVGLMGVLADTALAAGGEVIGIIPRSLEEREVGHRSLTELRVVESMHERKALMADLSDAFIAAPGGIGTLEELVEVYTWSQLGIHAKPVALLDVAAYWHPLVTWLDHAVQARFLRVEHRETLLLDDDPSRLLDRLEAWEPPAVEKWLDRQER